MLGPNGQGPHFFFSYGFIKVWIYFEKNIENGIYNMKRIAGEIQARCNAVHSKLLKIFE